MREDEARERKKVEGLVNTENKLAARLNLKDIFSLLPAYTSFIINVVGITACCDHCYYF
jgi:hypothetical protein